MALTDVGDAFARDSGVKVTGTFGASACCASASRGRDGGGVWRRNMDYPAALAQNGKAASVVPAARNRLRAISKPELGVTATNVLGRCSTRR